MSRAFHSPHWPPVDTVTMLSQVFFIGHGGSGGGPNDSGPGWNQLARGHSYVVRPACTLDDHPDDSEPVHTRQSVSLGMLNHTNPTTFGSFARYSIIERTQADWSPPQVDLDEAVWETRSGASGAMSLRISSRYGSMAWAGVCHAPRQYPKLYAEIPITST